MRGIFWSMAARWALQPPTRTERQAPAPINTRLANKICPAEGVSRHFIAAISKAMRGWWSA